jgi:hypothetical protein
VESQVLRDAWGQPWALDPSLDVSQQTGAQHWHASFEQWTEQRGGHHGRAVGNPKDRRNGRAVIILWRENSSIQVTKKTKEEGLVCSQDYEMICELKMNQK